MGTKKEAGKSGGRGAAALLSVEKPEEVEGDACGVPGLGVVDGEEAVGDVADLRAGLAGPADLEEIASVDKEVAVGGHSDIRYLPQLAEEGRLAAVAGVRRGGHISLDDKPRRGREMLVECHAVGV